MYIYGHSFTLTTDNKALEYIFNNLKTKTLARIERWCLRLAQYNYTVKHRPGCGNPATTAPHQLNIVEEYVNYIFTNVIPKAIWLDFSSSIKFVGVHFIIMFTYNVKICIIYYFKLMLNIL